MLDPLHIKDVKNRPRARERLSPPLTRPSGVTLPPAFLIRASSSSSSGLWSADISTAFPSRHTTHLAIKPSVSWGSGSVRRDSHIILSHPNPQGFAYNFVQSEYTRFHTSFCPLRIRKLSHNNLSHPNPQDFAYNFVQSESARFRILFVQSESNPQGFAIHRNRNSYEENKNAKSGLPVE